MTTPSSSPDPWVRIREPVVLWIFATTTFAALPALLQVLFFAIAQITNLKEPSILPDVWIVSLVLATAALLEILEPAHLRLEWSSVLQLFFIVAAILSSICYVATVVALLGSSPSLGFLEGPSWYSAIFVLVVAVTTVLYSRYMKAADAIGRGQ